MKVLELLKISCEMMKMLHKSGISIDDYKYLPMLKDFEKMKECGEKTTYIVIILSEKYNICQRKVYKVLKRLFADC